MKNENKTKQIDKHLTDKGNIDRALFEVFFKNSERIAGNEERFTQEISRIVSRTNLHDRSIRELDDFVRECARRLRPFVGEQENEMRSLIIRENDGRLQTQFLLDAMENRVRVLEKQQCFMTWAVSAIALGVFSLIVKNV